MQSSPMLPGPLGKQSAGVLPPLRRPLLSGVLRQLLLRTCPGMPGPTQAEPPRQPPLRLLPRQLRKSAGERGVVGEENARPGCEENA